MPKQVSAFHLDIYWQFFTG